MLAMITTLLLAAGDPDATYTLTLQTSPRLRVAAELTVRGDDDGSSAFSAAPMWGGIDHCARYLHELAFFADGLPVAADHPKETAWVVAHAAGARLQARWFLDPLTEPLDAKLGNDYRPILTPKLFHLLGETGLLSPDSLDGETPHAIRLEWKGFAEAGWKVASSFGDAPAFTRNGTLASFKHAAFLAGELHDYTRELHGTRLLFALHGTGYAFSDDALVDLGARVVTAERDFFSDWSDPLFVVTLIPEERPNLQSLGGTGLTDSFSLFMSKGMSLKAGSDDAARIAHLLAHEYFHHWNGGKIKLEEPEQLGYWFSEGFTDFFARRILLRSGIFDVAEYVRRLNESLDHYWQSPVRAEKNARIVADFWKVKEVGELPYRRGDLVALLLDHEIRASGDGKRSLDDFFREALQRGRERGEICSTDNLLELAADYTSQEFADRLRGLIVDGNDVTLESDLGAPFLTLRQRKVERRGHETIEVPQFELLAGADLEAARAHL
jgi:predicted metalloprotease with PDZ domain